MDKKDYKLLLKTTVLAGEIMLESGAETYRVEDTMSRMLRVSGLETVETFAVMTGIMATIDDPEMEPMTYVKSVSEKGLNLSRIIAVNQISRGLCDNTTSIEHAFSELKKLKWKQYNSLIYNVCTVGITMGFAMFFGGTLLDVCLTGFIGVLLALLITMGKKIELNSLIQNIINGATIAIVAMVLQEKIDVISSDVLIISAIMPLVPGVAITNAVRDILHGDYISGNSRTLKAFLTAAGIAIGIGCGLVLVQLRWW